jgi:sulfite reductase (NADPH) flavoprotein alpha-component
MSSSRPNTVPSLPENAPFNSEQRAWINGFLAGLFYDRTEGGGTAVGAQPVSAAASPSLPLLVMFGSQTGTAETLAARLAKEAATRGFLPRVFPLNDYAKANLTAESRLVIITSTWGDGDPPDNAAQCWAWLSSAAAPRLEQLSFAVLGLGDRSYADFCGAARKFDTRLEALGARRLVPRGECDVDYDVTARTWTERLWPVLACEGSEGKGSNRSPGTASPLVAAARALNQEHTDGSAPAAPPDAVSTPAFGPSNGHSRSHPFPARLLTNRRLNKPGSAKDTRHFEIALDDSVVRYEVGDALGVLPQNCPVLVEELLAALSCKGEEEVVGPDGSALTLHDALLNRYAITQPPSTLIRAAAERAGNKDLLMLLQPERKVEFDQWILGCDLVDILHACPSARFTPAEFVGFLRLLQPRLYSISSSPKAHPGEVHLTVASVRYDARGRSRKGVASCWLADRVRLNETPIPVFVQPSHGFRLPADSSRAVIMIGPGTGIAPFRAFLEERRATGATGKNWRFFGDQQRASDFLYEEELAGWQTEGLLTRLDLAFSRDQTGKIYVQHRMQEAAADLWRCLEDGAHFYVCGDAKRMAKDVDTALHEVIARAGNRTIEAAREYVMKLREQKRYQRDVY